MRTYLDPAEVARTEQAYSTPPIARQREETRKAIAPRPGERGLDVGCGPGFLACELALEVAGLSVAAIDCSPAMLATALAHASRSGVTGRVALALGDASILPFPDAAFDFVVAAQVYRYVLDVEKALAEAVRVLRPGGRAVVVESEFDSLIWLTSDRARNRRMLDSRDPDFAQPHIVEQLPGLFCRAGLDLSEVSVVPLTELRYDPDSFSANMIESTRRAALRAGIPSGDVDAWESDLRGRGDDGDYFFSVDRFIFTGTKAC